MTRLKSGQIAPEIQLPFFDGGDFDLQNCRGKWTLLSFHRYAACPVCNVTMQSFRQRYSELSEAGLTKVAIFHSPQEKMLEFIQPGDFPFQIALDPTKESYKIWGVEAPLTALFDPRSGVAVLKTLGKSWMPNPARGDNDMATCPADFFVDPDLVIRHAHYGAHIGDSMKVDDVLETFQKLQTKP